MVEEIDKILEDFEDGDSAPAEPGKKPEEAEKKAAGKAPAAGKGTKAAKRTKVSKPGKGGKGSKPAAEPKGVPEPTIDLRLENVPCTAIKTKAHQTNTREKLTDADLEDILESAGTAGIRNPIRLIDDKDGSFTLVTGKRRLAAARKLALEEIPALVSSADAVDVEVDSAIENLVRRDYGPIEEAKAYHVLIKKHKVDQKRLAKMVGRSESHISRKLSLLDAPAKTQKKLEAGKVTEKQARSKASKSAPGAKRGPKMSIMPIPPGDLPYGVSLSVREGFDVEYSSALGLPRQTITLSVKVDINTAKKGLARSVGKAAKLAAIKMINEIVPKNVDSAYKAIKGV